MSENYARLASFVRMRRNELALSQDAIAKRGGPSTTTQSKIEAGLGHSVQPISIRRLEDALEWPPGSAANILNGGLPLAARHPATTSYNDEEEAIVFGADGVSVEVAETVVSATLTVDFESPGFPTPNRSDLLAAAYAARSTLIDELAKIRQRHATAADFDLAARRGYSQRARLDHHADTLGEESQDPGGFE